MLGAIPAELLLDLAKQNGAMFQLDLDLECPPWIFVNPEFLTSVSKGHSVIDHSGHKSGVLGTEDHPYFRDTRLWLARNGYIDMQTQWSNGDRVTKPFYFNNVYMCEGEQFSCAAAMHYRHGKSELYNEGKPLQTPNYDVDQYADTPAWPDDIKQVSFPDTIEHVDDELDDLF